MILTTRHMKKFIYFHIIYVLISGYLYSDLGLPYSITYLLDIMTCIEFVFCLCGLKDYIKLNEFRRLLGISLILFLVSLIGFFANHYSIFLYIWGLRNTARYIIFLFCCCIILDRSDIDKVFSLFLRVLYINVILCTFQYFVQHKVGDFCGGLFGTSKVNSYMNVLLCITFTWAVSQYIHKKICLKKLILLGACTLYISVLAELKFFFFEIILILLIVILLSRPSKRVLLVMGVGILSLISIIGITSKLWESSAKYFSIEGIQYYITQSNYGYATADDIGRINGIEKINQRFFKDKVNLIGLGLGSCDTSSVSLFNSAFYQKNGYLHYTWFGYLHNYLETGWIGLLCYILFYIYIVISGIKYRKNYGIDDENIVVIVQTLSLLCIVLMWYNTSIRNTPAYMLFGILSFIIILNKTKINE